MRKRILPVMMALLLLLSVSVQAAESRAVTGTPSLSFSGTTATCEVMLRSGNSSDKFSATLTLKQGSSKIDSWTASGSGRVSISEQCSVKKGSTYTLTLSYTLNGVSQPAVSVNGTC